MSLLLLLLTLFCACVLLAALNVPSLAPAALVSSPVLIALITHLLVRTTTGAEHAAHVFATMVNHPVRAAQALICATIRQLPLPPWLADWLTTLATRMAELQRIGHRTHDEVVTLGALLRELSVLLAHLTGTFGDFTARTARISELAMHVPVAMAELMETACADKTALDDVARRVACVNTSIIQVRGEILELQQYVE
jgi:hypothetical protein